MDFTARYILVKPSSPEALQSRLQDANTPEDKVKAIVEKLPAQLDESKTAEVFDTTIVNETLDDSHKSLVGYLFGKSEDVESKEEEEEPQDIELKDADADTAEVEPEEKAEEKTDGTEE